MFEKIEEAWQEYSAQELNVDLDNAGKMAERDAFFAGAEAMLSQKIPF